jgi:2-hydroxychromene-2-carboxylate isomerase
VNKPLLRQYTQEAQQRGIFGAPMMWVGNELFWGDDRLEEAIELAVRPGADQ